MVNSQTQIKLLLKEQFDLGLHCLLCLSKHLEMFSSSLLTKNGPSIKEVFKTGLTVARNEVSNQTVPLHSLRFHSFIWNKGT